MCNGDTLVVWKLSRLARSLRQIIDTTYELQERGIGARRKGRKGGRPPRMTKETVRAAEAMIKDRTNYAFITDIIQQLGIGRTTFYGHFPPERISELRMGATQ